MPAAVTDTAPAFVHDGRKFVVDNAAEAAATVLPLGVIQRPDGVFLDASQQAPVFIAAVNQIFANGAYLAGLDYPVFVKALFNIGQPLPPGPPGQALIRVADAIRPFDPQRRPFYRAARVDEGIAEYVFEPLYYEAMELPDGTLIPERPARLEFDEFVADMWTKGVRVGIEADAVKAAMAAARGERCTIARRLEPEPSADAHVIEVSQELHRSDAPREKADGRVDLNSFQNRFPQIRQGMRLLKKVQGEHGRHGLDLDGSALLPQPPADLDFRRWVGDGTLIDSQPDGEYLVAAQDGFLDVDAKSGKISVRDKIVSREGVSGRTTGNLALAGAFEEFGDVQEMRAVDGSDITIHGNVFGNINSTGGSIVLGANLVGGSAYNARGSITLKGVGSAATLHTRDGEVRISGRVESCVIVGTRVVIEEASNCEILADEVEIGLAEGCAVAARQIKIESAGPRRQSEMLVLVQVPDLAPLDAEAAELRDKIEALEQLRLQFQQEANEISAIPQVRGYLALTAQLRKGEFTLTAEQVPRLKKMAATVEPQLRTVAHLLQKVKAAESQQQVRRGQIEAINKQKQAAAGQAHCQIQMVSGETSVRAMPLKAGAAAASQMAPKDAKALLRGPHAGYVMLFSDTLGSLDWTYSVPPE
jgi:hypothetical protein